VAPYDAFQIRICAPRNRRVGTTGTASAVSRAAVRRALPRRTGHCHAPTTGSRHAAPCQRGQSCGSPTVSLPPQLRPPSRARARELTPRALPSAPARSRAPAARQARTTTRPSCGGSPTAPAPLRERHRPAAQSTPRAHPGAHTTTRTEQQHAHTHPVPPPRTTAPTTCPSWHRQRAQASDPGPP